MNLLLIGPSGCGKTTLHTALQPRLARNVNVYASRYSGMLGPVYWEEPPTRGLLNTDLPGFTTVCVWFDPACNEMRVVSAATAVDAVAAINDERMVPQPHTFYVPYPRMDWVERVAGAILALYPELVVREQCSRIMQNA